MSTIRTSTCSILISKNETRCSSCVDYRKILKVTAKRYQIMTQILSVEICHISITTDQRNLKLEAIQRERKSLLKNKNHVETKIENMISREGVAIEEEKIQDILGKFLEEEPIDFNKNSANFLLLEQQKKINL